MNGKEKKMHKMKCSGCSEVKEVGENVLGWWCQKCIDMGRYANYKRKQNEEKEKEKREKLNDKSSN